MTLSQQYEAVFGGSSDPSRKKIEDLPYQIRIVSRKIPDPEDPNVLRCAYCKREECISCPLPFEDKITLQNYLDGLGVSTQSYFYYEDPKTLSTSIKESKRRANVKRQLPNLEFELEINFNSSRCWALYENLVRYQKFDKVYPEKVKEKALMMNNQNDKVTIDDCFRQFMIPEKLSHSNQWFCNRCKSHKQAVKKI